ncbi:unnamed protein product [Prunus brigantina]
MPNGSQTIDEYLNHAKSLADALFFIQKSVSDEDLVTVVLRGLGSDFSILITPILNQPTLLSFTDLRFRLLAHPPLTKDPLIRMVILVAGATVVIVASLVVALAVMVFIAGIILHILAPHPLGTTLGMILTLLHSTTQCPHKYSGPETFPSLLVLT